MSQCVSLVIINPAAAMGKTAQRSEAITEGLTKTLGSGFRILRTNGPGDAESLAREAVRDGMELIIAVGGDGTIQEIVNGMLTAGKSGAHTCGLGIITSGTGNGFAQSLGLPGDLEGQLAMLRSSHIRAVDVAWLELCSHKGRFVINETQIGIGGEVVRRVRGKLKMLGGKIAFGVGTVASAVRFPNRHLTVVTDAMSFGGAYTGITISNGEFTGGGMNLTPGAAMDDGALDVLVMHAMGVFERLWNFPKIYSANHLRSAHFSLMRTGTISVASDEVVPVAADGELLGFAPCSVRVVPHALKIRMN